MEYQKDYILNNLIFEIGLNFFFENFVIYFLTRYWNIIININ